MRNSFLFQALTTIDFKTVFDGPELSALGEGRLKITVRIKDRQLGAKQLSGGVLMQGTLGPKISCDLFDCVMADSSDQQSSVQTGKYDVKNSSCKHL